MLECYQPDHWDDCALLEATPKPGGESWRMGMRFREPPTERVEILIDPTHSDRLKELYKKDALIMSKRMVKSLQGGGVDNLDVYEAVIRNPETRFETTDYVAVNLIGLVRAADLAASEVVGGSADGLIDVDFDSVVIDSGKARQLLMFRLAENTSAVVVHEQVRDRLLADGFDMLEFVNPTDWVG